MFVSSKFISMSGLKTFCLLTLTIRTKPVFPFYEHQMRETAKLPSIFSSHISTTNSTVYSLKIKNGLNFTILTVECKQT